MASTSPQPIEPEEEPGMAARIRGFDWASTPLGPIEGWPPSLQFALSLCEHSSHPCAIYWGPDFRLIYNDAWAVIPAERHPAVLGLPAREAWPELWPIIEPQFRDVVESGRGFSVAEQLLPMLRGGQIEETYWNYSFSPLLDENGAVAGIFNQGHDITKAVLAERRMAFQIRLADRLRGLVVPQEIKRAALEMLGDYLGVARVGYAEADPTGGTVSVRREWTRDPEVPSLATLSLPIHELGEGVPELLRTGEPMAIGDIHDFRQYMSPERIAAWEQIAAQAMVVMPLVRDGELKSLLYVHDGEPRAWKRSEVAMVRDVAERTWAALERAQAEQLLRDSEDHYRHAVELNPQVSWTATPDGQLNRVARRWHDWTGTTGLGDSWAEGLHPDDREFTFAAWGRSVATGEPYDIEHRVRQRDGSYRWARSRAFPRRDEAGAICLWYGATEDIHERKVAEEHQRLLINELNHRVKNTLATVQAIAFQTLKGEISLDEARRRFEARLLALSRAHNLLTEQNWEGASLDQVVADSVEPLAGDRSRFDVGGESIWLSPRAALALALAFHELSTNAVKYGALKEETGRVSIHWKIGGDGLAIEWKEHDGPAVAEPAGRGFGTRLIERGLAADLGGSARLLFEPTGLRCVIEASLAAIQAREDQLA